MIKLERGICPNQSALDKNIYNDSINKTQLIKSTNGKCMYCESTMNHITYGDIEHIKPKSIYPKLTYEWNNLGISCEKCNRTYKGNKDENFINPYEENPEEYLIFTGEWLSGKQGNEKGEISILGIGLNRPGLLEKRRDKLNSIEKSIQACFKNSSQTLKNNALEELKNEANNSKEFSLLIKTLFKLHEI